MRFLDRNPPQILESEAKQFALDHYGLEGDFSPLTSERDANFRIHTASGDSFVLKIANADEKQGDIDFQTRALLHVEEQDPDFPVPRLVRTRDGESFIPVTSSQGTRHLVHALSFLTGRSMVEVPTTPALWHSLGKTIARLDLALRGFFHPNARRAHPWDLTRSPDLRPHASHIADRRARRNIEAVLDRMAAEVLPRLRALRHQVIHGDANPDNVLVDPDVPDRVAGILDFGDMVYAPLIAEPAIAADLESVSSEQGLENLRALISGFDSVLPLEEGEIDLLYDLILARRAITAVIIAWRKIMSAGQPAYLLDREQPTWNAIDVLLKMGRSSFNNRLRSACRFPPYTPTLEEDSAADPIDPLLKRRHDALGSHLSLFYSRPVHIERGRGTWLFDTDGRAYLDAYNNVPVVGHGHPHVVRAITRQTEALNTNTRYLYRSVIEYAERLTDLMHADLSVCVFVNSGSEANDIAWRMAQFATGARGALVMEHAYHGITEATAALSASEWATPTPSHVQTLITPDPYRGPFRSGESNLAQRYATDADWAIHNLIRHGLKPAMFMVDTIFSSSGIPNVPPGYLKDVCDRVQAAGGLIIADEVQAGFGRCGMHLWGYEMHGIVPDIVTLGKPVGSGYPLGVVITRRELLNPFVHETGLFSTFGGNPVACAAGMAVLDVIEDEELLSNAQETGEYLREGLRKLASCRAWIGDVRGHGLMIGVELVHDRKSLEPASEEARHVLDLMRDQGVLIGRSGPHGNVLKIRPPLVFQPEHADLLIEAIDRSLAKL
ncbi:MAG TPA: aminotransferase class III-fold pyridoxal phosphate-dependent enzyme [Anaerolineae bacterium]|nr:aminotransferase class III-fold pyridoxal phosphate-dependent enzyme [Anaerolineae bacterium]